MEHTEVIQEEVHMVEAVAIKEALHSCITRGINQVVHETDSIQMK